MLSNNQHDTVYNPEICKKIPELFKKGDSITQVAVNLGISRQTYYNWKENHPEFKKACETGESIAQAKMEKLLLKGIKGKIKGFQVTGMIFLLKSRFREVYADEKKEDKSVTESLLEQIVLGKIKVNLVDK